uniref:Uncharacterized protein n=1 Tax=Rhizophora mucronata TaxID=61149 RepID=A0A2P2Q9X9_RHIMU
MIRLIIQGNHPKRELKYQIKAKASVTTSLEHKKATAHK